MEELKEQLRTIRVKRKTPLPPPKHKSDIVELTLELESMSDDERAILIDLLGDD